jgi:hypothetical protein
VNQHPDCRFRQTVALPPLRQSKCAGHAHACAPTKKGFLICWRFKVKMIGESKTDKVECPAMGPTAALIWFGSELELRRPA